MADAFLTWLQAMATLRRYRLPVDPCRRALDARGYSPLHWAARGGNVECIYLLLAETPRPQESWGQLLCRRHTFSPAQIVEVAGGLFFLDSHTLAGAIAARRDRVGEEAWDEEHENGVEYSIGSCPSACHYELQAIRCPSQMIAESYREVESARAASQATKHTTAVDTDFAYSGAHCAMLMAALESGNIMARVSFLAAYTAALLLLGMCEPHIWWTLAVTSTVLHGLLPYIHKSYVTGLAEARAMAASCGLGVSGGFSRVDPPHAQALYEQFLSRRATRGIAMKSIILLLMILMITNPARELLAALLFPTWISCAPAALGCAFVAGRTWAIHSGRITLWRWLDICLDWYLQAVHGLPCLHMAVTGRSVLPNFPSEALLGAVENAVLLGPVAALSSSVCCTTLHSVMTSPPMTAHHLRLDVYFAIAAGFVLDSSFSLAVGEWDWRRWLLLVCVRVAYKFPLFGHHLYIAQSDLCAFLRLQLAKMGQE